MTKAEKLELVRSYLATFPNATVRTIAHGTGLPKSTVDRLVGELKRREPPVRFRPMPEEADVWVWLLSRTPDQIRAFVDSYQGERVFGAYLKAYFEQQFWGAWRRGEEAARAEAEAARQRAERQRPGPASTTVPELAELGLEWPCTELDVKRAVKKRRAEVHPDRHGGTRAAHDGTRAAHDAFIRLEQVERDALAYVRARAA